MKQVILVRKDLDLGKGKLAAQVGHAAVDAMAKTSQEKVKEWLASGGKKIVLKVKDLKELQKYEKEAKKLKLITALIQDAGLTAVEPGTITCLGIGPDDDNKIDKVTGKLKML